MGVKAVALRKPGGTIMRVTRMLLSAVLLLVAALPAAAEVDEATRAQRWSELRAQIFGERAIADGSGLIAIEAPDRAEDAAIVPIKLRLSGEAGHDVKQLYLVIDDNPSPLAGRFVFGPAADSREIAVRVRIDD